MASSFPRWLGDLFALIFSALAAFFGVLNILFSDIFGAEQRFTSLAYVFVLYAVFGFLFCLVWPDAAVRWVWWFGGGALLAAALITLTEPRQILLNLLAFAVALLGARVGTRIGQRIRRQRLANGTRH